MSIRIINDDLPEPIFLAVQNDRYDPGLSDYTPSSLNSPAYQRALIKAHEGRLSESASGCIWRLLGSSVHYMIELAGEKAAGRYECERRFYGDIETQWGPKRIGAQVDILDRVSATITDMKVTGCYGYGKTKDEWTQQLNVGRWCVRAETGFEVERLVICAIWRDWTKSRAGGPDYPPKQVTQVELPVWSFEETEAWMLERVHSHELASELSIEDIPVCSPEEMWAKPDKFAVCKPGAARALKVYDERADAEAHASKAPGTYIEPRLGARTRCEGYCPASSVCPAYAAYLQAGGGA